MTPGTGNICRSVTVVGMTTKGHHPRRRFKLRRRLKPLQKASIGAEDRVVLKEDEGPAGDQKPTEISLSSPASDQSSENDTVLPSRLREVSLHVANLRTTTLSHGSVSIIGRRKEMEDTVRVELKFLEGRYDFFGVYDGHGGPQVAQACAKRLHEVVVDRAMMEYGKDRAEMIDWEEVMVRSFKGMDEEVAMAGTGAEEALRMVGSTAVVAVIGKDDVVVANCGDSRAVMSRGGVAVALSDDHKPGRPDELKRIEAAGGRVINWNGYRVLGVLATSRSIGDEFLKPFVISIPEVTVTKRTDSDEFLILASDGLWDVVSNEYACEVVRRCLSGRMRRRSRDTLTADNSASEAAKILAELAISRGSEDNISVIVVELNKPGFRS
ncbi:protein phosphatase 2C 51-like [Punica granatum]|uniref:protein-serine/threonine phosphatase n=2 Tax=Punica granatum TaxID=22663 RepID=A0A218WSE5_PUNGR|nr:protein phosphatase 2C 51-like [Punica granatum]OWM75553.1 hypothetical protein CDL15_Pgr021717 [Punica granatum]PKI52138.1 hypothetical protein CRG98_027554 [Punica granatum]